MNIKDFKVGDKVYHLCFNNRSNGEKQMKVKYVVAVGRKFIKLADRMDSNYLHEYYVSDRGEYLVEKKECGIKDIAFKSKQDYDDYIEYGELELWFYKMARDKKLTLDQLRKIKEIVESEEVD